MLRFYIITVFYLLALVLSAKLDSNSSFMVLNFSTLIYLGVVVWGVSNISSQMFVKTTNSNYNTKGKVAITFDDGPHSENTPKLLQILNEYNAKASFFLIGKNISKHKDIAINIAENGHVIGNHSYNHSGLFPLKFPTQIKNEIRLANAEIEKITNKRNKYFRPPFGVTNPYIAIALSSFNLKVIGWSIRSFDTVNKPKEQILKRVIKNIKEGDIILLHDSSLHVCWLTIEILKHLKEKNIKAVTIEELMPELKG